MYNNVYDIAFLFFLYNIFYKKISIYFKNYTMYYIKFYV